MLDACFLVKQGGRQAEDLDVEVNGIAGECLCNKKNSDLLRDRRVIQKLKRSFNC
jgi:hypothetical protein